MILQKFLKKLSKKISYIHKKYYTFKENPLTQKAPLLAFVKYLYINFQLYVLKVEKSITFLGKVNAQIKKGDGIVGNYHSLLQEPNDSIFLLHFLRTNDFFIDIGANVGHYTLIAGVYGNARVTAVEPIPSTFNRLQKNVSLNKWNHQPNLLNIGLSDKVGVLNFTNEQYTTNKVSNTQSGIAIPVETLDNLCKTEKPIAIKVDVEGYEWFVLSGGLETIASDVVKVIIIELNQSGKNFGIEDENIINLLKSNGFSPYVYDIFKRELVEIQFKNNSQFNTLFIKDLDFVINRVQAANSIKIGKFTI